MINSEGTKMEKTHILRCKLCINCVSIYIPFISPWSCSQSILASVRSATISGVTEVKLHIAEVFLLIIVVIGTKSRGNYIH